MKSACVQASHCVSWGTILLFASGLAAGQSWRQINSGLPVTVAGLRSLTFDPTTPLIVYGVGPNGTLFKSNDGGQSWNAISRATSVRSVVVDPKNSANVYALARNGVLKSADHGETWTVANAGLQSNSVYELVIVPTDPQVFYAVAGSGRLFKSTDGAQSWRPIGATFYAFEGADTPLASASLNTIIVDPKNPLTLYAQVYSYVAGLFKSTDGGVTWYQAALPLPMNFATLPVFSPQAPSTLYLWYSDYSYPAKTGGGHLLQSTDDGTSWNDIGNGGVPAGSYLQNLTFDAKSPSIVFATYGGDEGWGLVKSTDGGKTWNQLNTGLPPYDTASIVAVSPDSTVYAGYVDLTIGRGRLVKSADGGTNWSAADSGLTYIGVLTLAIDPTNAADVYAGVGAGGEGVFKTMDDGGNWSNLAKFQIGGPPASPAFPLSQAEPGVVNSLLIDFANPKVLYAATARIDRSCIYTDKLFFKSTDGGTSWDNIANPPQGGCGFFFSPPVLTLAPNDSNELYLGGEDDCGGAELDQSPDGGSDWKLLPGGISSASGVNALAADPTNLSTLYVGAPEGVFKSTDGGANWTSVFGKGSVAALAMDPAQPNTLYAAMGNRYSLSAGFDGVFKSVDDGENWSTINTGLESVITAGSLVTAIVVAPRNPNMLYLASSGGGVYKSSDGGSHWAPFNENMTNLDARVLTVAPSGLNRLYAATPGGVFTIIDEPVQAIRPRR